MGDLKLAKLMTAYCNGDTNAFTELYQSIAPAVLGYLVKMCGEKSLAEDLLQQTFLKVHKARSTYISNANPTPWIYSIAHRTFIDAMRKKKRAKVAISRDGELADVKADILGRNEENQHAGPDPEQLQKAMEALSTLPEKQRQAVVLVKLQGKSLQEAANICGITVGAMKVRAHRGYNSLRKTLVLEAAKID